MEELKRFEDELKNNEELKKKFDEAIRRIAGEGLAKSDGELMSMAAKELGFDISVSASEKAKAREEVADPDELDAVTGGGCALYEIDTCEDGHDAFCMAAWHCFTAFVHTETDDTRASCWKDYRCNFVYEMAGF